MVTDLMKSNTQLRQSTDQLYERQTKLESDNYYLQIENRDLRDKIEILESVIASTTKQDEFDSLDWRSLLSDSASTKPQTPALKSNNLALNDLAAELIETKKLNRQMTDEMESMRASMQQMMH